LEETPPKSGNVQEMVVRVHPKLCDFFFGFGLGNW
jgi:hypothetical protein